MDINRKFIYFTNHGNVYFFEERYPEALELFQKGYELVKASPEYAYAQNVCMLNIGATFLLMNQLDSAQYYLDHSYSYFQKIGNSPALYHTQTQMFELAIRKDDLVQASHLLQNMTEDLQTEPTLVDIRKKYLQHYYEKTGNYNKAYQYIKENQHMDDSIRNERIRMRVAETDLRYKQDTTLMKQRMFIQKQQSDMQSLEQQGYIWILICLILMFATLFIYFYLKKQRALLLAETRNKIIGLRMESIRNRVSPHFIFNTLNRIISHHNLNDDSDKELRNLIKIMRLNLSLTEKLCITLAEEIDFVRTYLDLEQKRFDTSLHIDIQIDPEIDLDLFELPAMLIQIPVENAMKHGLQGKEGDKRLSIIICQQKNSVVISIEDNGFGFRPQPEQPDMQSTRTGLKVVSQTIELLNMKNSNPISMQISRSETGTEEYPGCLVRFILPEGYSYRLSEGM